MIIMIITGSLIVNNRIGLGGDLLFESPPQHQHHHQHHALP